MDSNLINELRAHINALESNFKNVAANVILRNKKWDQYEAQSKGNNKQSEIITLNVGGYKYTTFKSTLLSLSESNFQKVLDDSIKTEDNEYFIDRPGESFDYILKYLRNSLNINTIPSDLKYKLVDEAEFYGLTELAEDLQALQDEVISNCHKHPLKKKKIQNGEVWECRGKWFYSNGNETCREKDKLVRFKYSCSNNSCLNPSVEYCLACAERKETTFKSKLHGCMLNKSVSNSGWACNGGREKDGCFGGFKDFYKTTGEIGFACRGCDFDLCEKCMIHYNK